MYQNFICTQMVECIHDVRSLVNLICFFFSSADFGPLPGKLFLVGPRYVLPQVSNRICLFRAMLTFSGGAFPAQRGQNHGLLLSACFEVCLHTIRLW